MSPEKQRIAIAEACGWRRVNVYEWKDNVRLPKQWIELEDLPDYLNDLNAMHEAEGVLCVTGQDFYLDWLLKITGDQYPIFATAAQRAEAFLKTIGKWEE